MRRTNLTSADAQTVLDYCHKHHIMLDSKLERELVKGCETVYLKNRSEMTTEEKKKIDAWLDEQMGDD